MEIVRLAEKYRSRGVVGVDMAGDELLALDKRHVEGFKAARELGLHVTVHAAESGPAANVQQVYVCMGVRVSVCVGVVCVGMGGGTYVCTNT